jgi:hypothetical protein
VDVRAIFELIVRADERLKYATEATAEARRAQARELLERALAEAEASGNEALVAQARTRLVDLESDIPGDDQPGRTAPHGSS